MFYSETPPEGFHHLAGPSHVALPLGLRPAWDAVVHQVTHVVQLVGDAHQLRLPGQGLHAASGPF